MLEKIKYPKWRREGNDWPAMRYHPETGAAVICEDEASVPEGYVESLALVGTGKTDAKKAKKAGKPTPQKGAAEKAKAAEKTVSKVEEEESLDDEDTEGTGTSDDEAGDDVVKAITLEALETTRKEAIKMLKAENVKFNGNSTNDELAALLYETFDYETSE